MLGDNGLIYGGLPIENEFTRRIGHQILNEIIVQPIDKTWSSRPIKPVLFESPVDKYQNLPLRWDTGKYRKTYKIQDSILD